MNKTIENEFMNPEASYRGAPFWAWNGKLEEDELRRQIRIMHQMGLGGFFMHSRVGLDTAYLSEEWFDRIKACIDEAEKLGMKAWLYDEDRWPSGAAGGLVTKNPEYRARFIVMKENGAASPETAALFAVEIKDGKLLSYRKIKNGEKISPKEKILEFHIRTQSESSWYNGQTYLDTLSHDAVKEFIKVTHEAYKKNISSKFGKAVPGIFTDEPNFMSTFQQEEDGIRNAWTKKLPEIFKKRYGYDIMDFLPEIFMNKANSSFSKVRWNYFDCVTYLFADAFSRQIGEWCEKNDMLYTGHVLVEDTLSSQTSMVGSTMRSYEYMQAPGMDLLTEHWRVYNTAKQVSSAANQFGAKWRLTETYGCTGWDFPFAGQKALGDWQAALGINLRCQHLAWYTMQGEAKRDYPASIFYQSPWWESYSKVEDYFGRINCVMTKGSEIRDLLVIHPVESMW
ncbi:MAG: glycosyl hydrolase, partial [Victivallales bacterium]